MKRFLSKKFFGFAPLLLLLMVSGVFYLTASSVRAELDPENPVLFVDSLTGLPVSTSDMLLLSTSFFSFEDVGTVSQSESTPTEPTTPPVIPSPQACKNYTHEFTVPIKPDVQVTKYVVQIDEDPVIWGTSAFMDSVCAKASTEAMAKCEDKTYTLQTSDTDKMAKLCAVACVIRNQSLACPPHPEAKKTGTTCGVKDTHPAYLGSATPSWCRVTAGGSVKGVIDCHCGGN
jgi:hypothetical protein